MYGWLTYQTRLDTSGIEVYFPGLIIPGSLNLPAKDLAQRAGQLATFLATACQNDPAEARKRIQLDFVQILRHLNDADLEFAMYICRAHHLLPDPQRLQRTATIARIVDGQFEDIKKQPPALMEKLASARLIAILIPDAFMDLWLRTICASFRTNMLNGGLGIPQPEEYADLVRAIEGMSSVIIRLMRDEARTQKMVTQIVSLMVTRPGDGMRSVISRISDMLTASRLPTLEHLLESMKGQDDLPESLAKDALAHMIEDASSGPPSSDLQEIINTHLASAHAELQACREHVLWSTIAALDQGLNVGKAHMQASRDALSHMRQDINEVMLAITPVRAQQARESRQQQVHSSTPPDGHGAPDDLVSWSVDQLARWIEGPVTELKEPKKIDRQRVIQREQAFRQTVAKATKDAPPAPMTDHDVGGMIEDAISATARFFLGDVGDMLTLAGQLPVNPQAVSACAALLEPLKALATPPLHTDEVKARSILHQTEAALLALRNGIQEAKASAQVQRRFPGQLSLALSKEALAWNKRFGGTIACPVRPSDWTWVVQHFHGRWLPQITQVLVDGKPLPLAQDQAVALYVTGSSLSGYAFDVSAHVWRRREGRHSLPSAESGPFPPMNTTDWFDTRVPCCVLHVPHAQ